MIPLAVFEAPKKPPAPPPDMTGCADSRVAHVHAHAHAIIRRKGKEHADGANDPLVISVMGHVNELLPPETRATPMSRMQRNAAIGDSSLPMAHAVR